MCWNLQGDSGGALTTEEGVLVGLVSAAGSDQCGKVMLQYLSSLCFKRTLKIWDQFSFCEIQDNFYRKVSSTIISRLLPSWPGSNGLYWRWEACSPAILCMRRQTQRVSFFPVIRTKNNCILSFWPILYFYQKWLPNSWTFDTLT